MPKLEPRRGLPARQNLAEQQEEPTTRRIKGSIRCQVETERAAGGANEVEEDRVPSDSPRATRFRIERQGVAQEPKAHLAMLGTHRIVKAIIEIVDLRQALDHFRELLILLAATASVLVDHTELT